MALPVSGSHGAIDVLGGGKQNRRAKAANLQKSASDSINYKNVVKNT